MASVVYHEIRTASGSRYYVTCDAERWWFGADNVPNEASQRVPEGLWEIERPTPWPPMVGSPLLLLPLRSLQRDDPRRVPGGGKFTSAVVEVIRHELDGLH